MNNRSFRVLEFDKIIEILSSYAISEPGKELCRSLKPVSDVEAVKVSLLETDDAVAFLARRGSPPLSDVKDIRSGLRRAELGGALSFSELLKVCDVLRTARRLKEYSSEVKDDGREAENSVAAMISSLYANKRLEDRISSSILSEDEMADDASPELFRIRRQIRDTQSSLKEKLNSLVRSPQYQKYLQDAVVTLREDRYVIPVKVEYKQYIKGLVHDASSSGQTLFIEPMSVVEANNKVKELRIKEQKEIERILYELSAMVNEVKDPLTANVKLMSQLDFCFAKAKFSLDYNCVSPRIEEKHVIRINKGRHPLIDPNVVVPIDFWIGDDFDSLIITGPNTGGKTVTLKTVGLFTLMTQAGLHIPASEGTQMTVFNNVFADIGDEQSIEQSLSTFSSHMKNIVSIIDQADHNSLVLFDELGAGTDPTEGAALAMSILENLHHRGCTTVATTHYSELKMFALTTDGFENACCEFDVDTLRPTYKLLIGVPGKSNAFAISQRLGLDDNIISRAKDFLTQEDLKFENLLYSIEKNKIEAEEDRSIAASIKRDIEKQQKALEEKYRKLSDERDKIIRKAKEESLSILSTAKEEAESILSELRKMAKEQSAAMSLKEAEKFRQQLAANVNKAESQLASNPLASKQNKPGYGGMHDDNAFPMKNGKPLSKRHAGTHFIP